MISPESVNPLALPSVPLEQRSLLPTTSCIYFAIDSQEDIQYIGRSVNAQQRWMQHHRYAQLNLIGGVRIAYLQVDADLLTEVELALIEWFKPPLNRSRVSSRPVIRGMEATKHKVITGVSRVTWKLREVLARRRITNKALAEKMGVHPTNISRLKNRDTLPAIGSDEIERFRVAITELSPEEFGTCTLSELIGLEES